MSAKQQKSVCIYVIRKKKMQYKIVENQICTVQVGQDGLYAGDIKDKPH